MHISVFDFNAITSKEDFYRTFTLTFMLAEHQVCDLDSLWDVIMCGSVPLPQEIVFTRLSERQQRRFGSLILLFEEAEEELGGKLFFNIQPEQQ